MTTASRASAENNRVRRRRGATARLSLDRVVGVKRSGNGGATDRSTGSACPLGATTPEWASVLSLDPPVVEHRRCHQPLAQAEVRELAKPPACGPDPPGGSEAAHGAASRRRQVAPDEHDQPW